VQQQIARLDPMVVLIALLESREQPAASARDAISLERAITRQAEAVLRCASRAAVETIRDMTGLP
jgi:hypothetical protein